LGIFKNRGQARQRRDIQKRGQREDDGKGESGLIKLDFGTVCGAQPRGGRGGGRLWDARHDLRISIQT